MQIIRIMGGSEHIVPEEEAEIVAQHYGTNELMALSDGSKINTSSIAEIANIPLVGFYKDYIVNKDGRTFTRDGQRITIEYPENIEYLPDPKYEAIAEARTCELQRLQAPNSIINCDE
ncbi:MAG: hypothetical protein WC248_05860 [Candidatus Methanomethylophilaceae archaeon]|jgi:hypothetical protein